MKQYPQVVCLLITVMVGFSCASKPVQVPTKPSLTTQNIPWPHGEKAIHLDLTADTQLNVYDGNSHTLFICVYQLKNLDTFDQLTGDDDGLYKILECGLFDPSVRISKRLILNPGEHLTIPMYRDVETNYVAIIAGYFSLEKEKMVRLFDIPLVVEKTGTFSRKEITKHGNLNIELVLGPQQVDTPSRLLRETQITHETPQEDLKEKQKADRTTETDGKTIKETIEEVKETAEKTKETVDTVQKAGKTIQKAQEAGGAVTKTPKSLPKAW